MNIEWDYNYYQPWSDNEWLVDEILAMLDEHVVTLYKCLGQISDNLHLNNQNNQLESRARPPRDVQLNTQSWTRASSLSSRVVAATTATYTS